MRSARKDARILGECLHRLFHADDEPESWAGAYTLAVLVHRLFRVPIGK